MSSTQVERPVKVLNTCVKSVTTDQEKHKRSLGVGLPPAKKNKNEEGRFKFGRKRSQSYSSGNGKFFLPHKKRKREGIVPPTKFLLGGNIFDPLNLNSLQDEETNRVMNAVTPKSSPLPTPKHRRGEVEVLIPPNINDPLNLINCDDDAKYEEQLVSPTKKCRKKKKKKRNSSSSKDDSLETVNVNLEESAAMTDTEESKIGKETVNGNESVVLETVEPHVGKEVRDLKKDFELPLKDEEKKPRKSLEENSKEAKKHKKNDLKDKIVSPVIPQPGAWPIKRQPHRAGGNIGHCTAPDGRFNKFRPGGYKQKNRGSKEGGMPKFLEKNKKFQYGNYNRYYGYRNPSQEIDVRLKYLQERKDLFYEKDVLDIGCNIGHVTLTIARDFGCKSIIGLDIDRSLIEIARVNVRHYVKYADSSPYDSSSSKFFPISMPILYGPVDIPGITKSESPSVIKKFPHNVSFVQGNYVLESDVLLQTEQPQFDVILALSITKWFHLNWGDAGLKRAFKRMFLQLRPGGKLILEVQAWDSYKRKKNLTETIFKNYSNLEFLPDKFTQYLLSSEVGFSKCEVIGVPFHQSRGFRRPIQLFTKGESPSHSILSTNNTPFYTATTSVSKVPVYTSVVSSTRETDSGNATPALTDVCTPNATSIPDTDSSMPKPVYPPVIARFSDDGSDIKDESGKDLSNEKVVDPSGTSESEVSNNLSECQAVLSNEQESETSLQNSDEHTNSILFPENISTLDKAEKCETNKNETSSVLNVCLENVDSSNTNSSLLEGVNLSEKFTSDTEEKRKDGQKDPENCAGNEDSKLSNEMSPMEVAVEMTENDAGVNEMTDVPSPTCPPSMNLPYTDKPEEKGVDKSDNEEAS